MNYLIIFFRFLVGWLFIFSGFIKLNDPLGFSYKLQEYFEVFGVEWLSSLSLFLAISICSLEVLLGLCLLLGSYIKCVMWGNLALIIFFTFLTFYSAYFNKVTDCGCFGDAIPLSPWESFTKDVILLILITILFVNQDKIKSIFSVTLRNKILLFSAFFTIIIPINALSKLPIFDFRPYRIGANIIESRQLPDDAKKDVYEDRWYYEINGEVKEFSTIEEPWKVEGAIFKDRKTKLVSKGDEAPIHDFDIIDEENGVDMTDSILRMKQVFLLISYDIEKTNISAHKKIETCIAAVSESKVPFYGLSSSSSEDVKNKLLKQDLNYPYFLVDQITLKTMIRSNPGLFLLENGIVTGKWHWRDIPNNPVPIKN